MASLVGDCGVLGEPLVTVALGGFLYGERSQPLFGVEKGAGNGGMWRFSGFCCWDVEWDEVVFVGSDELLLEETGDG